MAKAGEVPAFNIIQPTPPRSYKQHHRLLYRGSLSLPDSDLILDGITFTAHLPPTSPTSLLKSPLALALESMRGRPSLRFVATVKLSDVHHEYTGDISMYIHPHSVLARGFFENVLCADEIDESGHTVSAIRIGLGDGHGPDEYDLLVFGSLLPSQSTLRMTVARVTSPRPPAARIRAPRPDDPTPRRPPVLDLSGRNAANKRRRIEEEDGVGDEHGGKRGKVEQLVDLKTLMAREAMFKLPSLGIKGKGKARADGSKVPGLPGDEDVFRVKAVSVSSKAANDLEVSNKTMIKKAAVKALGARGMPKEHPEFKELFGWVTRGVGFALRQKMKIVRVGNEEVQRLADSHVLMYFDGFGGPGEKGFGSATNQESYVATLGGLALGTGARETKS